MNSSDQDSVFDVAIVPPRAIVEQPLERKLKMFPESEKIASVPKRSVIDRLDYEIFPVESPDLCQPNRVQIPGSNSRSQAWLDIQDVEAQPQNRAVFAVTGTTGCVKGRILESPCYLKLDGFDKLQEMWQVKMERATSK